MLKLIIKLTVNGRLEIEGLRVMGASNVGV